MKCPEDEIIALIQDQQFEGLEEKIKSLDEPFRSSLFSTYWYEMSDFEKALDYAKQSYQWSVDENYLDGLIRSSSRLAECLMKVGSVKKAHDLLASHESYFASLPDLTWCQQKWLGYYYYQFAIALSHIAKYRNSAEMFEKALGFGQLVEDKHLVSSSYNGLAIVHEWMGMPEKALDFYKESLKTKKFGSRQYAVTLCNMGALLATMKRSEEASEIFREALAILEEKGGVIHKIFINNQLGGIALDSGLFDLAEHYYLRSYNLAKLNNLTDELSASIVDLTFLSLNKRNLEEARNYVDQFKDLAKYDLPHKKHYAQFLEMLVLIEMPDSMSQSHALQLFDSLFRSGKHKFNTLYHALMILLKKKVAQKKEHKYIEPDFFPILNHALDVLMKKIENCSSNLLQIKFLKIRALMALLQDSLPEFEMHVQKAIQIAEHGRLEGIRSELEIMLRDKWDNFSEAYFDNLENLTGVNLFQETISQEEADEFYGTLIQKYS